MAQVFIISTLARQIDGDLVHQLIELVTTDKKKAEEYFQKHIREHVISVDGVECVTQRGIIEADLQ